MFEYCLVPKTALCVLCLNTKILSLTSVYTLAVLCDFEQPLIFPGIALLSVLVPLLVFIYNV